MNLFKIVKSKYLKVKDPAKYWKKRGLNLGDRCEIYPTATFGSEPYLITLGNHVRVNAGVNFVTHDGGVWVLRDLKPDLKDIDLFGKITVGDNVHIGTNSIIMPGVTIGNNCIIGCGAIVTKDIPSNSIAVVIPARVIETIDEYVEKQKTQFLHTKSLDSENKKEAIMKYFEDSYNNAL